MNKRKRRRLRLGGEKQIEPLARGSAIGKIEMASIFAPYLGAACCPIGNDRIALGDSRGVVVGGIELGTVHSAVQHGAGSGSQFVGRGSLPRDRRQSIASDAGEQSSDLALLPMCALSASRRSWMKDDRHYPLAQD
jgi:hypothetical protein